MRPVFIIAAVLLAAAAALVPLHLSVTNEEFSRYNPQWNGTSAFYARFEDAGGVEADGPGDPRAGGARILLVIAPYRNFSAAEGGRYRAFLSGGRTIFLADDFGTGNELLASIGSGIRILPGNLASAGRVYGDISSVEAFRAANDSVMDGVSTLSLDRPAAVDGGGTLAATSILSWIDADGNGLPGPREALGKRTVLAREEIGGGTLYVFSDPSIFINGMDDPRNRDNRVLVANILSAGPAVLDQSHARTGTGGPVIGAVRMLRESLPVQVTVVSFLILIVAYLFRKRESAGGTP